LRYEGDQIDTLSAEFQFVTGDATDVQQVIYQPHHVRQLTLHYLLRFDHHGIMDVNASEEF